MSGKQHRKKGRGGKAEQTGGGEAPGISPALLAELERAEVEHHALLLDKSGSDDYAHQRAAHLAGERLWSLRSSVCFAAGKHDAARKAASTANGHATMAARLERDSIADRVAALEAEVNLRRGLGRELEELEG